MGTDKKMQMSTGLVRKMKIFDRINKINRMDLQKGAIMGKIGRALISVSDKVGIAELAKELNVDYIVLMAAINDLIDQKLGGFREEELNQVS